MSSDVSGSNNTARNASVAASFHTYSRICPGAFHFALWALLSVPAAVFFIIYFTEDAADWALYTGLGFIALFFLRWLLDYIHKLTTYAAYKEFVEWTTYKDFTSPLGYRLDGWEAVGSFPNQLKNRYWSKDTVIEVVMREGSSSEKMHQVKKVLQQFMEEANKNFYEAEPGGDGRTRWEFTRMLKITGSTDTNVIGALYVLFHEHLRNFQHQHPVIDRVKIKFDPNIFKVEPPPHTD